MHQLTSILPLLFFDDFEDLIEIIDTPLYVYCYSGVRSGDTVYERYRLYGISIIISAALLRIPMN